MVTFQVVDLPRPHFSICTPFVLRDNLASRAPTCFADSPRTSAMYLARKYSDPRETLSTRYSSNWSSSFAIVDTSGSTIQLIKSFPIQNLKPFNLLIRILNSDLTIDLWQFLRFSWHNQKSVLNYGVPL